MSLDRWLDGLSFEKSAAWTPAKVHALADAKGIPWDNDRKFMMLSEQVTGKRHLDKMSPAELGLVAAELEKLAGKRTDEVVHALKELKDKPIEKEHLQAWSRHAALNAGLSSSQAAQALERNKGKPWVQSPKEELKDAAHSAVFALIPPNHHTKADMVGMMRDKKGRKTRHRDWFSWGGRWSDIPEPSKLAEKKTFYHGSPTKGLAVLQPRKDPRTGEVGLFVDTQEYSPEIFSLMPKRHKFSKDVTTKAGKFIRGEIIGKLPLKRKGYVYTVEAEEDSIVEWKPGKYILNKPAKVVGVREVTRAEVMKRGWKVKTAEIHVLTGSTGTGKSTTARKLVEQGKYDVAFTSDIGDVKDGRYTKPANKDKARADRQAEVLAAHKAGKRVIFEGYPKGLTRYPEIIRAASSIQNLEVNPVRRYAQIGIRSLQRGSSIREDVKMGISTGRSDRAALKELYAIQKTAEVGGHWRTLKPGGEGHDQGGNKVMGKTWVSKNNMNASVKLKPHQADFVKAVTKAKRGTGTIAGHGTGTGKTISGIAAFEELKQEGRAKRALVVAPAGLRNNFLNKGVNRFTSSNGVILTKPQQVSPDTEYVVVSYAAFRQNPQAWINTTGADTIIADEFHRAGNPNSSTHQAFKSVRGDVKNFIGLTASVTQNSPADVVPLVNLAKGDNVWGSKKQFRKRYIKNIPSETRGIFGGKRTDKKLIRKNEILQSIGPTIHYVEDLDATEKPAKDVSHVEVKMSREQLEVYKKAMKGIDPKIAAKIAAGEKISKRERGNVFEKLMWARQVSNSLHGAIPGMSLAQAAEKTPKIKKVLDEAEAHMKKHPDAQVIMYTNVVRGGVDVLQAGLAARGIAYGTFAGKGVKGITEASRQQDVNDYLEGKKKVIIITAAGAEGISLGNTTMVQVVDGHYNPERVSQAEARGIRAGGLSHRPQEERRVDVRRYVSSIPKSLFQTITFQKPDRSVDQWIYQTAGNKSELNDQMRAILAARSEHEQRRRNSLAYRAIIRTPKLDEPG